MMDLCIHCKEPITRVDYGPGMTWAHIFESQTYYFCKTAVATPKANNGGQDDRDLEVVRIKE
jgi:hypothetical protein